VSSVLDHLAWNALEASLLAAAILLWTGLRPTSAPVRHALWLLVAVKLLLPPAGIPGAGLRDGLRSVAAGIAARTPAPVVPAAPFDAAAAREEFLPAAPQDDGMSILPEEEPAAGDDAAAAGDVAAETSAMAAAPPAVAAPGAGLPAGAAPAAAALWLAGAAIILCRRARRILALRALLRAGGEAPLDVLGECADLAARLGIRSPPRVLVAPWAASPFLSAAGAPAIVLPACLLEPAGRGALRAVLAHELGHLKRHDHWASWVDLLATAVFWWLPTAWIAGRAMERASDEAADACAARALGSRRTYAEALIETLEVLTWKQAAPFAIPGRGLGEKEAVERRLVMVLRHPLFTELSLRSRIALVALGLLVLPAAPGPAPGQSPASAEPVPAPEALPAPGAGTAAPADSAPAALPVPEEAPALAAPSADDGSAASPAGPARFKSRGTAARNSDGYGYGAASTDDAPRGFEERLSAVEKKVDRLLREMEKLTRAMGTRQYAPAAGGPRDYDSPRNPAYAPRAVAPRTSARTSPGSAIAQPSQATDPAMGGPSERLRSIERRFEERARALRKELADLEAALEEEMRAAAAEDPDGGGNPLDGWPQAPGAAPVRRPPRALNVPNAAELPTPVQPAQPAAVPAPSRR
jgi:beta-lactamase regulating signal transducer with metallopeptidase domain